MNSNTKNYRKQKYACCKLIAAINARIWLGGHDVSDSEFEELAELAICKNGPALNMSDALVRLGLVAIHGPVDPVSLEWIKGHLPVAIGYCDPQYGFHEALIIAVDEMNVSLVNAAWESQHWNNIEFYPHSYNRRCISYTLSNTIS